MITSDDVQAVADGLGFLVSPSEIKSVIKRYPTKAENTPNGVWDKIIEQIFYDLRVPKLR